MPTTLLKQCFSSFTDTKQISWFCQERNKSWPQTRWVCTLVATKKCSCQSKATRNLARERFVELVLPNNQLHWSLNSNFARKPSPDSSTYVWIWRYDSQRSMLQGIPKERNLRSKFRWFTEFCNSHYVSHFAAFFIVTRTKISTAKSCSLLYHFELSLKLKFSLS